MWYDLSGVDSLTGAERSLQLEAGHEQDAIQKANQRGLFPDKITLLTGSTDYAMPDVQRPKALYTLAGSVFIVVVLLVCAGLYNLANTHSSSSDDSQNDPQPASSFANDQERLEWRSKNHLPMTDEDVKYEQSKIRDAEKMLRDSEIPIGH